MSWMQKTFMIGLLFGVATPVLALTDIAENESDATVYLAKKEKSDKKSRKNQVDEDQESASQDEDEESDSSAANQRHLKFTATATVLGFASGSVTGGDVGYFLRPDFAIMGRYEKGALNFNFLGVEVFDYSVKSFGVYGKKFWGNSFYTNVGLFHRSLKSSQFDSVETDTSSTSPSSTSTPSNSTSVTLKKARLVQNASQQDIEIAIGNQWQWDNFTLGCDWVGFAIPLSKKIEKNIREVSTDGGPYEEDTSKKPSTEPGISGLRFLAFYLGVSF